MMISDNAVEKSFFLENRAAMDKRVRVRSYLRMDGWMAVGQFIP